MVVKLQLIMQKGIRIIHNRNAVADIFEADGSQSVTRPKNHNRKIAWVS